MTKIILANILWCILFSTLLTFSNGLMEYDESTLRKFPYVMPPTPFRSRLTRDVQDVLNQMAKGDDGSQGIGEIQNASIENQIQEQHNIGSEQLLPPQSNYQYTSPQMYGQQNIFQQQSQNNIRQALEFEAVHHQHHNHQEQNQQNFQQQEQQQIQNTLKWNQPDMSLQNQVQQQIQHHVQQQIQEQHLQEQQLQQFQQQQLHQQHLQQLQQQQLQQQQIQQQQLQQQQLQQQSLQQQQQQQQQQPQLPLYTVPPQIHNQLQSIYQQQQPIPTQNSIPYSYNQNHMSAPYPPKMEVVQPSLAYLPSTLQPPSVTSTPTPPPPPTPTPLIPTTQTPIPNPTPPPPMVNITPKPRISNTYIPVMPPTSPKPTKAVITNIYSYDSPNDSDEDTTAEEPEVPSRQHYKILFIRAPNQISKNTIRRAHAQHQNQQKTVVYILSKKTDVSEIRDALQYLPTTTSKPEVHFIRYKTEDEAEHAKHQIQHHYHQLSDSTHYSNEGTPLITSAIGILPRSEADTPNNAYLPPIQQNNDLGYLPPALPSSQSLESTVDSEYLPPSK